MRDVFRSPAHDAHVGETELLLGQLEKTDLLRRHFQERQFPARESNGQRDAGDAGAGSHVKAAVRRAGRVPGQCQHNGQCVEEVSRPQRRHSVRADQIEAPIPGEKELRVCLECRGLAIVKAYAELGTLVHQECDVFRHLSSIPAIRRVLVHRISGLRCSRRADMVHAEYCRVVLSDPRPDCLVSRRA